jgi:hypothetical protein
MKMAPSVSNSSGLKDEGAGLLMADEGMQGRGRMAGGRFSR